MAEYTIKSLSEDIAKLIEVHNEMKNMWMEDRELLEKYKSEVEKPLTVDELKKHLGLLSSSALTACRNDGIPSHHIDGVRERFYLSEVNEWLKSKASQRYKKSLRNVKK